MADDRDSIKAEDIKGINYKELLKKYMNHVYDCEGSDFTRKLNDMFREVSFSDEEIKILKEL